MTMLALECLWHVLPRIRRASLRVALCIAGTGARLPVIAAADGVVLGRRDGMEDSPMRGPKPGKQEMQQWRSPGPWRRLDDPILPSATRQRYGAQG
ncbi:MAG: hypothetical protein OXF26_00810 [Alphaproteobacteria bacterium]|nr:hypothetical protein [Alphaproteobacteria bacterium]MCY4318551.1 hypothetical protein [Alphaproteobacteria bacterium]